MQKNKKAFTLIELLIVITIIGILAVALLPKIASGPARARDVARKADIPSISSALELYYADHGSYVSPTGTAAICTNDTTAFPLVSYFDGTVPEDPTKSSAIDGSCNHYLYTPDGAGGYALCAKLEAEGMGTGYYSTNKAGTLAANTAGSFYCVVKR